MSTDESGFPSVEEQQRKLREAEQAVESYQGDTARKVLFAWFSKLGFDVSATYVIENGPDTQTSFCNDCSEVGDQTEAEFHWTGWGSLCAVCSLMRFKHGGDNPRIAENAERRWSQ